MKMDALLPAIALLLAGSSGIVAGEKALPVARSVHHVLGGPVTVYDDEARYLRDLALFGLTAVQENFEDEPAWGAVRTTIAGGTRVAPFVLNLGITWTSNHDENDVTTSQGAARTGSWGFYSSPHGNYLTGTDCFLPRNCGDGFRGTGDRLMFAVGAWIETNTPFAALDLFLDGYAVDLGDAVIGAQPRFIGAITSIPFTTFEFLETEGTIDDVKLIFADDFTLGVASPPDGAFLSLTGSCPGPAVMLLSGVTPDGIVGLLASDRVGPSTLPPGPCSGNEIGLVDPRLLARIPTDGTGGASFSGNVPMAACGLFLQVVEAATCAPTNLVRVP